jgi:tryptophan 2,3-dioxygenase
MPDRREPPSYWRYLRLDELLSLQNGLDDGRAPSSDELRFIVVHQVDELWFKLVVSELEDARNLFALPRVPEASVASAVAALRRVALIFELAAAHFRLMETMRTQDYLRFRDKLSPASGFQSAQMREIEILMGLDDAERIPLGPGAGYRNALRSRDGGSTAALQRVERRIAETPTLKAAVYAWLLRTPIQGSTPEQSGDDDAVRAFLTEFLARHEQAIAELRTAARADARPGEERSVDERYGAMLDQARAYLLAEDAAADQRSRTLRLRAAVLFIESHRELPLLSWPGEVIDGLIAAEQSMLVFRQRHARMVERVIGRRVGTGGSEGVAYLDQTALAYRVFKEIWAARTLLLAPERTPPVRKAGMYGLRAEEAE